MSQPKPGLAETAALTRSVTALSIGTAAVLLVMKGVVWAFSGSVALMASTADSGLDLIASAATFFAVRYAAVPPDEDHRFGHGKAEAFASLLQAGLVFASAALILQEAVRHLINRAPVSHETWAMGVMAVSILATGALVVAQTRMLRRASSVAVSGDRVHYLADLASNLVVMAGVAGSALLHAPALDVAAGLAVAGLLLWGAIAVFREASAQLMDRELPDEARAQIIGLVAEDPRIAEVHQLRTRASGPITHIQMHAALDPNLTLEAAHQVVVAAELRILTAFPTADILIHADPHGRAEPHGGAFAERSGG
ncbi:MAG TPA: cation diffusion facilitator family transporter [Caulobacteraceae bacterium]|jgi:ferrous-iron efflux pump FieF|nr:cation diffusion facilitator family transporter [Caulobacteraceae bacterium]